MQARNPNNIKMIDVSKWQGDIDWKKVAASGVKAAYIKATEGKTYEDPMFSKNAKAAQAAGLKVGFYHYAHPEDNQSADEVRNFLDVIKPFKADLPHALDVEGDAAKAKDLTTWCLNWIAAVKKATIHPVMVYTGASFSKSYLGKALAAYTLWIAHYGANIPDGNDAWPKWSAFQYTDKGTVPGIAGNVDMNEFDLAYWKSLFDPVNPAPKPPAPKPTPAPVTGPYKDVPDSHWAAGAIKAAADAGLMVGHIDGTFKPDEPVTRAELAAVVERLLKK